MSSYFAIPNLLKVISNSELRKDREKNLTVNNLAGLNAKFAGWVASFSQFQQKLQGIHAIGIIGQGG